MREVSEKHLLFSGTAGVSFMVEMQQEGSIQLDEPVEVKLSAKDSYPAVYQFIPAEDISSAQLDVTVTSESKNVPAYLKVSRDCKDVRDNIDVVDYKGESIRLSFTKKGRITLSKFSIPPLTASNSSWFIGIAIKNASGDTPIDATKTVTLTLNRSFDYSYAHAMWVSQCAICIILGLVVSFWAWCNFREDCCLSLCLTREYLSAMLAVICTYAFIRGPKTYSYITFIVGSVLMVGAFQFVFADWYLMIYEGDRDHCYYNDFCYRVRYADIPYNLIVSNLAYVLHGIILAFNVLCMESEVLAQCKKHASSAQENSVDIVSNEHEEGKSQVDKSINKTTQTTEEEALKKKYDFSLGYALAWALCFEGMFSALYHLCPSRFTFQFDTAFMFVIAALSVVLLYNGIGMQSCTREVEAKRRVGAANLFLFFLVPLLIFNYFGTMYHSEAGLDVKLQIPFFLFLILWFLIIALWAGSKLLPKLCCKCHCKCCECCCSCCTIIFVFCAFGFVLIPVLLIVLWSTKVIEFSDAILWFCVAESCIASVGSFCVGLKCESSCFSNSKDRFKKLWDRICDQNCCSKEECCSFFKVTCKLLYTCSILALNCFALWIFFDRETTDKSKSPEKSRDLNQECIFLAFFDWHDVWHISSSFGLLMGALMVIHVSYKSPRLVRRQSQTGAASGASDELRPDSIIMDAPDKQDLKENAQNTPSNYENVPLSFENPCTVSNRDDVRTPARGLQNMTQSFEERNNQCISEMRSSKRFAKRH
ncbi:uncharacterized protein LOC111331881 isoform X2 [Stylophora pistillata]|nr:uncharacterized protein LOC111331881 isoform X2 [Stylophora pistillata]